MNVDYCLWLVVGEDNGAFQANGCDDVGVCRSASWVAPCAYDDQVARAPNDLVMRITARVVRRLMVLINAVGSYGLFGMIPLTSGIFGKGVLLVWGFAYWPRGFGELLLNVRVRRVTVRASYGGGAAVNVFRYGVERAFVKVVRGLVVLVYLVTVCFRYGSTVRDELKCVAWCEWLLKVALLCFIAWGIAADCVFVVVYQYPRGC